MSQISMNNLKFLQLLAEYRVVNVQQIATLYNISCRAVRKKVETFHIKKLISVMPMTFGQGKGRPENIIMLDKAGMTLLSENNTSGRTISDDRFLFKDYNKIEHEILANWFRIHTIYLQKQIPDISTTFISPTTPFLPQRKDGSPLISDTVTLNDEVRTFIPDGVLSIEHSEQKKRLLFFLEVDMGTESITSSTRKSDTIQQKITNYILYFSSDGYKRYQNKWKCKLNGFRVLFVTNTDRHKEVISRFLKESKAYDFVWVTSQKQLFQFGLSYNIWARGGNTIAPQQSILGPTLAQVLPLPPRKD